jgi:2-polyprenyl-3-methyl-5-hydroxy-6-metoxy-1,4-benzoquinol methylase
MTGTNTDSHIYLREIDGQRRTSLSVLTELVPDGSCVLDVGTGAGALGKELSERKACRVDGITHNPGEAAIASAHYQRLEVADLETRELAGIFAGARYDVIVCADVLEHLRSPEAVLNGARKLLAADGRLLLSVPNVAYVGQIAELMGGEFRYRQEGLLDHSHLRFFTRRSLLDLLGRAGWQVTRLETVEVELRASEFDSPLTGLPVTVQRRLLELPDALAYQFVVEARPAVGTADNRGFALGRRSAITDHSLALYWRSGQGYHEADKSVVWGKVGQEAQEFWFTLPPTPGIDGLRLDPADRPGFVHLYWLGLLSSAGEVLWRWDGQADGLAGTLCQQLVTGQSSTTDGGVVLAMSGDDAFIELPIPNATFAGLGAGAQLVVCLSWPMSDDYLALTEHPSGKVTPTATVPPQADAAGNDPAAQESGRPLRGIWRLLRPLLPVAWRTRSKSELDNRRG